jgi:hypothetical protein
MFVILLSLAFIDVEPFYSFRSSLRKWIQNFPVVIKQAFTPIASPLSTTASSPTSPTTDTSTQAIGNWSYTLNSIDWSSNTVTVGIAIQNTGDSTYPFGFGYQVRDPSFNSIYKLCAVDSNHLVFWDKSVDTSGKGFYSHSFGPGEKQTGTLKFTVDPESQRVYLTISNGGNPANKLFYLGNPR